MAEWCAPASRDKPVRDFARFATSAPPCVTLLAWSEELRSFGRPVLVVRAKQDRLMPREHGPRLAEHYPQGELVEIDGSSTLVPEDRPEELAAVLTDLLVRNGAAPSGS